MLKVFFPRKEELAIVMTINANILLDQETGKYVTLEMWKQNAHWYARRF